MRASDWVLLKKVSRSFYLTLRLLPILVRDSIALAYLLARLTDTKADGAVTEGERELLEREAGLRKALARSVDREQIEKVWGTIQEGQAWDQTRFAGENPEPLSREELERYTYLVAGCVGEFWTHLCARHLPGFSSQPLDTLLSDGIQFGRALQYVNILRDRRADAKLGRVYVSEEMWPHALAQAKEHLKAAERYVKSLNIRRLRMACALPFLMAQETLALVEANPDKERVKISRARVYTLLVRSFFY